VFSARELTLVVQEHRQRCGKSLRHICFNLVLEHILKGLKCACERRGIPRKILALPASASDHSRAHAAAHSKGRTLTESTYPTLHMPIV
jgi:hypothetical protein